MNRQEIMTIINQIAENEIHDKSVFKKLTSEQEHLTDTGIDSFDFIMLYMKLGEEFNIPNKDFKDKLTDNDPTLEALIDFISEYTSAVVS